MQFITHPGGFSIAREGQTLLVAGDGWCELLIDDQTFRPHYAEDAGALTARADEIAMRVTAAAEPGSVADLLRIDITLCNTGTQPRDINLNWRLALADQQTHPRWLIPALLYKDNVQGYPGLPSLVGDDLAKSQSPWWLFRSDLTAAPLVMAWVAGGAVAMVMEERLAGAMTSVGLDNRRGQRALLGAWPYREAPRRRDTQPPPVIDPLAPVVTTATLAAGETVVIAIRLYAGSADPHAYAPLLREMFARWDALHPCRPWFPTTDGADHAAYGLFTWHYDAGYRALWETCAYDRYYAKNDRHVDRFEMHTGFVSGIPYAYALREYGRRHGREDMAEAGKDVIDFCCEHLTPWGAFWAKFTVDDGWTTGWPSPQRAGGEVTLGSASKELQSRTLAEATLFAARAAVREAPGSTRERWTQAVCSNLDYLLTVQRPDGNPGAIYSGVDGTVLDWVGEEGIHWISALVEGWRLTGRDAYLQAAEKAGAYFASAVEDAYLTGAPEGTHLLPTSEDPQNAVIAYQLLWEATGEARWLALARQAADYFMTFRWQYNTVFPPMTVLGRYDYRTKGMDISSPNNVHLHPYGLIAVPELVRLWEATGDLYLLKQTRNNLLACHQMLAPEDGAFDARRGMMTERWFQTPNGTAKGGTLQLAHAWATGLVLYADLWLAENGQLCLDGEHGELVALEAVDVQGDDGAWTITNPWPRSLELGLVVRRGNGSVEIDGTAHPLTDGRDVFRLVIAQSGAAKLRLIQG